MKINFIKLFMKYLLYFGGIVFWIINISFFLPIPYDPIQIFLGLIGFMWFIYWLPYATLVFLCYTIIFVCISYFAKINSKHKNKL